MVLIILYIVLKHSLLITEGKVGFIVPVEGTLDKFIVGIERKFVIVQWDGEEGTPAPIVKEIGLVDQDHEPPSRLNDGKADPMGRIYAGNFYYNLDSSYS